MLPRLSKSISTTFHQSKTSLSTPSCETISSPTFSSHYSLHARVFTSSIQSRKNMFKTNIIVIHDQIPHISLPHPSFLRSRRPPVVTSLALLIYLSLFLSSETNNPHVVLFLMISHHIRAFLFFFERENLLHFCLREIQISLKEREREKKNTTTMGYH